jgi:hypothetical protein
LTGPSQNPIDDQLGGTRDSIARLGADQVSHRLLLCLNSGCCGQVSGHATFVHDRPPIRSSW